MVVLYIYLRVCFFNYPATTETYTYCHTLYLHYALPIVKPLETLYSVCGVYQVFPFVSKGAFPEINAGKSNQIQVVLATGGPIGKRGLTKIETGDDTLPPEILRI